MVVLVFGLLAVGCASTSGGSSGSSAPAAPAGPPPAPMVLFEGGQWAEAAGTVTFVKMEGGANDIVTEEGGNLVYMGSPLMGFQFENIIDASMYTRLIIETAEKTSAAHGYWLGGQLFAYYADGYVNEKTKTTWNSATYGYWNFDTFSSGKLSFIFSRASALQDAPKKPSIKFNPSQFNGFSFKSNGGNPSTIIKVTLE